MRKVCTLLAIGFNTLFSLTKFVDSIANKHLTFYLTTMPLIPSNIDLFIDAILMALP